MIRFARDFIGEAEAAADSGASIIDVLPFLRRLDADSFALLLDQMPSSSWPALSRVLPAAPSEEMQRHLTGDAGISLLQKSVRFVRALEARYRLHTGAALSSARILDFGCGYGRLLRLMLRYSDPALLFGCDPNVRCLEWCDQTKLPANLALSDELPTAIPFAGPPFDVIYAFSVFTHLSERVATAALKVLTQRLAPGGLLAITIRPIDFWQIQGGLTDADRAAYMAQHEATGFAFHPFGGNIEDFGDTSLSLEWLSLTFPELQILGYDWAVGDAHQIVLFMTHSWRSPGRASSF